MVSSLVYRPAWEKIPFRDDLTYAEDDEWSRRLVAAGWLAPYAEKSIAIHSHNYTVRQAYKRCYGDSFAAAATRSTGRVWWRDMAFGFILPTLADASRDLAWCRRQGKLSGWPRAVIVRAAQRLGKTTGFRRGLAHFHPTRPNP
jgi:rhamnosyltransferase